MQTEIPQEWTWSRIGDHFKRITRKNEAGVRRVLTASGEHGLIDQEEYFNKRVAAKNIDRYFHLKRGEFAYNRSAMNGYPFGATKRLDRYDDGVLSTLYLCFRLRPDAGVLSDYAVQLFDSTVLHSELQPIVRVGARAHGLLNVTPSDFMEVALPLPPLPEQEKIAAVLASVDEAIQATEAVIEQTRRVKEGLLQDLLTRGIGHTRFKQTEIGEIPESWEVQLVTDVCEEVFLGLTAKVDYVEQGGVPLVRSSNISGGVLDFSQVRRISQSQHEKLTRRRMARRGDVLISKSGNLGTCAIVDTDREFSIYESIIDVQPRREAMDSSFLLWLMRSEATQERMLGHRVGSTVGHLNLKQFRRLRIPVPPIEEQRRIGQILEKVERSSVASLVARENATTAKAGLLQDLLSGAVRVSA